MFLHCLYFEAVECLSKEPSALLTGKPPGQLGASLCRHKLGMCHNSS
jgi:hypothetical protein